MEIVIFETNLEKLNSIATVVRNYIDEFRLKADISLATTDSLELALYVLNAKKNANHLFLLAPVLNNEDSLISISKSIKTNLYHSKISIITSYSIVKNQYQNLDLEILKFINTKDPENFLNNLNSSLEIAYSRFQKATLAETPITIKNSKRLYRVQPEEIFFIESSHEPHRLIMHLKEEQVEFYGKLKNYESFHTDFVKCHQSFVVNLRHIKNYTFENKKIEFTNNEFCFVSHRQHSKITKALETFMY